MDRGLMGEQVRGWKPWTKPLPHTSCHRNKEMRVKICSSMFLTVDQETGWFPLLENFAV